MCGLWRRGGDAYLANLVSQTSELTAVTFRPPALPAVACSCVAAKEGSWLLRVQQHCLSTVPFTRHLPPQHDPRDGKPGWETEPVSLLCNQSPGTLQWRTEPNYSN